MLFKKLIAITIAYSFMLQLGSQFGVWLNYMANADYALEHCENKASKTMQCYGNCVLVKDIKSLEKNQNRKNMKNRTNYYNLKSSTNNKDK